MSLQIGQMYDTPSGQRVEIVPSLSYGYYNDTIVAGGSALVPHTTNNRPISDDWIIGARSWCTWQFFVGLAAGATLQVLLTADDIVLYDSWNLYPLWGGATTWNAVIFLPGWKARFQLINGSGVAGNLIQGFIKVQAVL